MYHGIRQDPYGTLERDEAVGGGQRLKNQRNASIPDLRSKRNDHDE